MLEATIRKELRHFTLDLSFTVGAEIVALFGPSGVGKTTILNCIAGLAKPDSGYIRLHDDVFYDAKTNKRTRHRQVGYMFQHYALFPHLTVWHNITYKQKQVKLAKQLLNELNIAHLAAHYPRQISGGEQQRVALARALATEPNILLLDEPFSALDEQTRARAYNELLRIHKEWKIPTIIITHQLEEAKKLADRILYIEGGSLIKEEQTNRPM